MIIALPRMAAAARQGRRGGLFGCRRGLAAALGRGVAAFFHHHHARQHLGAGRQDGTQGKGKQQYGSEVFHNRKCTAYAAKMQAVRDKEMLRALQGEDSCHYARG